MSLFDVASRLEADDGLHEARILLLLDAFGQSDGSVEGLTKLAKLDFLLRYPNYLERALAAKNFPTNLSAVQDHERKSVESTMVRYKYGPWDPRHRRIVNLLVAKGLARIDALGKSVEITPTPAGREMAATLRLTPEYEVISRRANVLKAKFDIPGTSLMRFVYATFPEIETLRYGEEIA